MSTPTAPPVSTHQLAQITGASTSFLRRHQREIPGAIRVGRHLRWYPDLVLTWMRERVQDPPASPRHRMAQRGRLISASTRASARAAKRIADQMLEVKAR